MLIIMGMNNQAFQEGFVKACMDKGLNVEEIEDMCKVATYAAAFYNKDFSDAFNNSVVDRANSENLSMLEKAALVKSAKEKLYPSE